MKIIDISPPIGEQTAVWPGDSPFSRNQNAHLSKGDTVTIASFTTSAHIGAHGDAPAHYHIKGDSIDKVDLLAYMGPCQVIEVPPGTPQVLPEHVENVLEVGIERVLFKTRKTQNHFHFDTVFCSISPKTVEYLAARKVKLIGIDTPSVDPFDSKNLPAHQAFYRNDLRNLEGLDLTDAEPSTYELIALPLKLEGMDGSPVRAVLRPLC